MFKSPCAFFILMSLSFPSAFFFFLNDPPPTEISPFSLPDALPICPGRPGAVAAPPPAPLARDDRERACVPLAGDRGRVARDARRAPPRQGRRHRLRQRLVVAE